MKALVKIYWNQYGPTKFDGFCLICDKNIPVGSYVLWKKEVGIIHIKCHNKSEEIDQYKEQALFYYSHNFLDEGNQLLKKIQNIKKELGIKTKSQIFDSNKKFDTLMSEWLSNLKKDGKWNELAKGTYKKFHKNFEEQFNEFLEGVDGPSISKINENLRKIRNALDDEEFSKKDREEMENEWSKGQESLQEMIEVGRELSHRLYENCKPRHEIVFDPSKPYENRLLFRKLLAQSKKYIYWADKYFDEKSLDLLISNIEFENEEIEEIKILSSKDRIQNRINQLKNKFEKLQIELKEDYEIDIQLKVISKWEEDKLVHDRFLITLDKSYTFASQQYIFDSLCTITPIQEKNNQEKLKEITDKIWESENTFDIIKDWDKIKSEGKIDEGRKVVSNNFSSKKYKVNCSNCGIIVRVPFKPDGIRPVYCKEHMKRRN